LEDIRSNFDLTSEEDELFSGIDWNSCPRHIAIIMDGNGRWAKARSRQRSYGHKKGVDSVHEVVEVCGKIPVDFVTFYAFSTENWKRSGAEVQTLMGLFSSSLHRYLGRLIDQGVRIRVIGDLSGMGDKIRKEFDEADRMTKDNQKICMTLALNYSGRADLVQAAARIANEVRAGTLSPNQVDEALISRYLSTSFLPELDLLIRTSGELRLSNFMLWENAYSELYFSDVLWPDFRKAHLFSAIADYQARSRRFGGA
jgi:undecaprenyl diphosphate synthase